MTNLLFDDTNIDSLHYASHSIMEHNLSDWEALHLMLEVIMSTQRVHTKEPFSFKTVCCVPNLTGGIHSP